METIQSFLRVNQKITNTISDIETLAEIVRAIEHFRRKIKNTKEFIGCWGYSLSIRYKWEKEIVICEMCIVRLKERYKKVLSKINVDSL